ncbi:hypothetical protein ST47_g4747 [Ascochyta rabiei]|uniref:Uncharacterized protein n=2 Tax=Didymella rabiei TaxID=5454 RepID=A0A163F1X6_DIDRA|nr:hypothetical protein ST47_g4747 [Ascochyta rabiei]
MSDSPAWFADNRNFSLHAAMRFTVPGEEGEIVLHTYTVRKQLSMMSLPDIENFRVFMREMLGVNNLQVNGLMEGIVLARWSNEPMGLDGYALERDMVRGEPEYVLFQVGLARLNAHPSQVIRVLPIKGTQSSKLVDKKTGVHLATYTYDNGPGKLQ